MKEMKADAAKLHTEAANFDQISVELQQIIRMVETVSGELSGQWRGKAGAAAKQALTRFREAGQAQISALTDISANIYEAAVQYGKSDDEQATSLAAQMNFG
ncbi:WXG100 family type VII secretion target [Mycobacterium camsae]|uniref:WXG100 family type VII secretion target n=1 Tax=Mycobacterium gordonae TaxID=1778 RepID=UPI0019824AB0|nr:WXG100 family type VII secretion target [Mycobacterium gordonae]